jgi:hypothetical protein
VVDVAKLQFLSCGVPVEVGLPPRSASTPSSTTCRSSSSGPALGIRTHTMLPPSRGLNLECAEDKDDLAPTECKPIDALYNNDRPPLIISAVAQDVWQEAAAP